MSMSWRQLRSQLPAETKFVAEIWEDNTPSIRRVERDGWQYVGRHYRQNPNAAGRSGWCRRYTLSSGE